LAKLSEVLKNQDVLEGIRLHAVGLENNERFEETFAVHDEEKHYVMYFEQYGRYNTWGYGDLKVTIDKKTANVAFYRKEIDGENWSKNWYAPIYGKDVELVKLLHSVQKDLLKNTDWIKRNCKRK
jgi:hypothetical protein